MPQPMKWEKASPELGELLAGAISGMPVEKKIMFGAPVYTVNRNMFAGVHASNIFLRLSETDRKRIVADYDEAAPFEPVRGHVMKEYVTVPPSLHEDRKAFQTGLRRAYDFASKLPTKAAKTGKVSECRSLSGSESRTIAPYAPVPTRSGQMG
jgi:TfoX/Sxy family transcriptional regulator of competence genes